MKKADDVIDVVIDVLQPLNKDESFLHQLLLGILVDAKN